MADTEAFTNWMANYSAFHVIDVVNSEASDFVTSNNGLRQIFFDFPKLVGELNAAGWKVHLNEIAPDYNSGRKCAIVKILAVRADIEEQIGLRAKLVGNAELAKLAPMKLLDAVSAEHELKQALTSLSDEKWKMLKTYKRSFPIWGGMLNGADTPAGFAASTGQIEGVNLDFPLEQIRYYLRQGHN